MKYFPISIDDSVEKKYNSTLNINTLKVCKISHTGNVPDPEESRKPCHSTHDQSNGDVFSCSQQTGSE